MKVTNGMAKKNLEKKNVKQNSKSTVWTQNY